MPEYEFFCVGCNKLFSNSRKSKKPPKTAKCSCGKRAKRRYSAVPVSYLIGGFYKSDNQKK